MKLSSHRYGKARVRVVKILRDGPRHTVVETDVQALLEGDFETSYTKGDNSKVVATDTVKNTINVLSRDHLTAEIEKFALHLARHFLGRYPQIERTHIDIRERVWERLGAVTTVYRAGIARAMGQGGGHGQVGGTFFRRDRLANPQIDGERVFGLSAL
jgi:urate oxidase